MRRIDGDGREQGIDFALEEALGEAALIFVELVPIEEADVLLAQGGEELLVPAAVLGADEVWISAVRAVRDSSGRRLS